MTPTQAGALIACAFLLLAGCSSTKRMEAIPHDLDTARVPKLNVAMTAERYRFTQNEVHVKAGTLVTIALRSVEGTHGFDLDDYGIDVTVEEGTSTTVRFFAAEKGTHPFHCSHFCGLGHFGMNGEVVVE